MNKILGSEGKGRKKREEACVSESDSECCIQLRFCWA